MDERVLVRVVSKLRMHVITKHPPAEPGDRVLYYRTVALERDAARQIEEKYHASALHKSGRSVVAVYMCTRGPDCPKLNGYFVDGKCNEAWGVFLPVGIPLQIE